MRHHRDDIGITQQVTGNATKQPLTGPRMGKTANNQEFGTNFIAGRQHLLADLAATTNDLVISLTTMPLEIIDDLVDAGFTFFRDQHRHLFHL